MGIAGCSFRLGVAEHSGDHRKTCAIRCKDARKIMPEVMKPNIFYLSQLPHFVPNEPAPCNQAIEVLVIRPSEPLPFLDHLAGGFPGLAHEGNSPHGPERIPIGGLLPIAL